MRSPPYVVSRGDLHLGSNEAHHHPPLPTSTLPGPFNDANHEADLHAVRGSEVLQAGGRSGEQDLGQYLVSHTFTLALPQAQQRPSSA